MKFNNIQTKSIFIPDKPIPGLVLPVNSDDYHYPYFFVMIITLIITIV